MVLCTVPEPADKWKSMDDLKPPLPRGQLFRIDVPSLEKLTSQMEDNCLLRVLKSVLLCFDKRFTPEMLTKIKIHIGKSDRGLSLRMAHGFLHELGIDAMLETGVTYDRLRLALKNGIPTVLIFKAPYNFSYKIEDRWAKEEEVGMSLYRRLDNHAVFLAGIDERNLYLIDPMYKQGQVLCKVPIGHFGNKWSMEYDDHGYTSSFFSRVERVAIFYSAFNCSRRTKPPKESIWRNPAENPRSHLEEVRAENSPEKKIESLVAEVKERYEFSQIHRYYDQELGQAKCSLKLALKKKHSLKEDDLTVHDKVKKLFDRLVRLDKIDDKLKARGIKKYDPFSGITPVATKKEKK